MKRKSFQIVLIIFSLYELCICTHFRGGTIHWKPINSSAEPSPSISVSISTRFYWRLNYDSSTFCDQNTIDRNDLIGEGGYIRVKILIFLFHIRT